MKRVVGYIVLGMFVCGMTSCGEMQTIVVKGTPGTEIYKTGDFDFPTKIGTIEANGESRIKLDRYGYTSFLLARDVQTGNYYPFGVDFKYGRKFVDYLPYITFPLSIVLFGPYYNSDQYYNCFRYIKEQYIPDYPNAAYANIGERREVKSSGVETSAQLPKEELPSATSKLLRKDYAEQLQGSYVGSGELSRKGIMVETYSNIKIVLRRVDRHTVSVEVLLEGEESVWEPCNYHIDHQGNGNFVLVPESNNSSEIRIKNNKVTYINPNVDIEGEIYKLYITASAEKKLLLKGKKVH